MRSIWSRATRQLSDVKSPPLGNPVTARDIVDWDVVRWAGALPFASLGHKRRIAEVRPDTTYDNFARDFGERFVPGYKAPSSVDLVMNAPFSE